MSSKTKQDIEDEARGYWQRKLDLYFWPTLKITVLVYMFLKASAMEPVTVIATGPIIAIATYAFYIWDQRNDWWVLETRINGDEVGIGNDGEPIVTEGTGAILWRVPETTYLKYEHKGERESFWHPGTKFIFSDYVDRRQMNIYHAKYGEFENVNFYTRAKWWLNILKNEVPQLMEENQTLKNLMEYKVNKKYHDYVMEYEGDDFLDKAQELIAHRHGGNDFEQ